MIRHIPDFILRQYDQQQLSGAIEAFALLFDVADFTPIGTQLQKHGKQGAEELSRFLDFVFGEPIRIVESRGGFVSLFAGDAFCAIFPDIDPDKIWETTREIKDYFSDKNLFQSPIGEFPLKIRQTVTYGRINWQIYENELQNEYVFQGEPIRELAELSFLRAELLFSVGAARQAGLEGFEAILKQSDDAASEQIAGYRPISDKGLALPYPEPIIPIIGTQNSETELAASFLNPRYHNLLPQNEIRSAAFCFAGMEAIPPGMKSTAISSIQALADRYGGFVNKYDDTDKGLCVLVLFGLPVSEGKTLERIGNFALEAVEATPGLALGISCGSVYAGFTGNARTREYTALGAPVSLANRLMCKARPGEVLTDSFFWQELHSAYDFSYLGSLSLKGIEKPVRYYGLRRLIQSHNHRDANRFVGRDAELGEIRRIVDGALSGRENIVLYVSGDAGIGKSRLVSEALATYGDAASPCVKYKLSCDAILRKPLEAFKQLLRIHFYHNPSLPSEVGIAMFRTLWGQIDPGDSEMKRIESIIASLVGYEWEGSLWETLPPEERPKQLQNAFLHFLAKLARDKSILLHLDDGQWIDDESKRWLQVISEAEISHLIIVSPCRFLEDGSKAELGITRHKRFDLEIDSLSETGSAELISHILRLQQVPQKTVELIYHRSMGNPLFIEQLSSYLTETGSVDSRGEIIAELGYLSSFSISDIVSSRIDRLTDKVRDCMFSASVLGMEFNIKVLSEMLKTDLCHELQAGTQNRIWKDLDELRYIFSHILIKDIVYERMLKSKLLTLHKIAAEAYKEVYKDHISEVILEILFHLEQSESWLEIVDLAIDERNSIDVFSPVIHKAYNIVIEFPQIDLLKRCRIMDWYQTYLAETGSYDESFSLLREMIRLLENDQSSESLIAFLAFTLNSYANLAVVTTGLETAREALEKAESIVDRYPDLIPLRHIDRIGTLYKWGNSTSDRARIYKKLLDISKKRGSDEYLLSCMSELIQCDQDQDGAFYAQCMEMWKACQDDPETRFIYAWPISDIYLHQKQYDMALEVITEYANCQEQKGINNQYTLRNIADIHTTLKHYPAAIKCLSSALTKISEQYGKYGYYYFVLFNLAELHLLNKDYSTAKTVIESELENISFFHSYDLPHIYHTAAQIYIGLGESASARLYLDKCMEMHQSGIPVPFIDEVRDEISRLDVDTH